MTLEEVQSSLLNTASRLRAFRACPRLHYYRYVLGAYASEDDAMRFGTLAHVALEAWFLALRENVDALRAALRALEDVDADAFEVAKLRALLVGYDARWREQPYDVLAVEQEFRAEIDGIPFGGKLDAVVRSRETGRTYVVEHKTT